MDNPTTYQHDGYQLICAALPLNGGGFSATLIVVDEIGKSRYEKIIPLVNAPTFATAEEAIEHSGGNGRRWVADNG